MSAVAVAHSPWRKPRCRLHLNCQQSLFCVMQKRIYYTQIYPMWPRRILCRKKTSKRSNNDCLHTQGCFRDNKYEDYRKQKCKLYSNRDGKSIKHHLRLWKRSRNCKKHYITQIWAFESGCRLVLATAPSFFHVARYSRIQQRLESQFHFRYQTST